MKKQVTEHHQYAGVVAFFNKWGVLEYMIARLVSTLTIYEIGVLIYLYGLDDLENGKIRTLGEVGKIFNVTGARIREIESKAFRKLRHPSRWRKTSDEFLSLVKKEDIREISEYIPLVDEFIKTKRRTHIHAHTCQFCGKQCYSSLIKHTAREHPEILKIKDVPYRPDPLYPRYVPYHIVNYVCVLCGYEFPQSYKTQNQIMPHYREKHLEILGLTKRKGR